MVYSVVAKNDIHYKKKKITASLGNITILNKFINIVSCLLASNHGCSVIIFKVQFIRNRKW